MKELQKYLPPIITDYREVQAIHSAEVPEFDLYADGITNAGNDLSIQNAAEERISDIERMFDCTPDTVMTLEERKQRLQLFLRNLPGYALQDVLDDIAKACMSGYFSYEIWYDDYTFTVTDCDIPVNKWILYYQRLRSLVPCNIILGATNMLSRQLKTSVHGGGVVSKIKLRRIGF